MLKHLLFRSLGLWTLRSVAYAAFTLVSILVLLEVVPAPILSVAQYGVAFLLSFLFAEWIFLKARMSIRQLALVELATFVWDFILLYGFYAWLLGSTYRYSAPFYQNLLFFVIHVASFSLAYYAKKRFAAISGLAEGLEA